MAFKKRIERESTMTATQYSLGIGRLLSLAYANASVMELGGPLATAIIMAGEAVTFSCKFERLVLLEALNILDDVPVEATVVSRDNQLYTETSILKYIRRPTCLENYSWYEYCCWFHRKGRPTTSSRQCDFTSSDPALLRAHLKSHNITYFEYPRVPEIVGPRLPDATRLGNEDYIDQTELYYRMSALLYKPFRSARSILNGSDSAKAHFDQWDPCENPNTARALERHQQYYTCLHMAAQYRARQRNEDDDSSDEDDCCLDDDDILTAETMRSVTQQQPTSAYTLIPAELYHTDVAADDIDMTFQSQREDQAPALHHILLHSITTLPMPADRSGTLTVSPTVIARAALSNFLDQDQSVIDLTAPVPGFFGANSASITIAAFERAIRDCRYDGNASGSLHVPQRASIGEVSRLFRLNELQHMAFTLIAVPILSKITGIRVDDVLAELFTMSPLIVTGAGGTGKSLIITAAARASQLMEQSKQRHDRCFHRDCSCESPWLYNSCLRPFERQSQNVATAHHYTDRRTSSEVGPSLVCDSRRTLNDRLGSLRFVGRSASVRQGIRRNSMIPVLMFDHCQLKPVRGPPMYKSYDPEASLTTPQLHGQQVYRGITKVIYLTNNTRFTQDTLWGEWLAAGRLGKWPQELRQFIHDLPDYSIMSSHIPPGLVQTISTDNATRTTINSTAINLAIRTFAGDRKIYTISAKLSRKLSPTEWTILKDLPDNRTGNIPIFLHVYIGMYITIASSTLSLKFYTKTGMPVRVKSNECVDKGIVNGAYGTIHHIDWPDDTTFTRQGDKTWFASLQPNNIYVNLSNSPASTRYPLMPPEWPDSVMLVSQIAASIRIGDRSVSVKGFPLVPSFGTTVHGVRGETRDSIAVTNLRPRNVHKVDRHALYVSLSRIRTRHGLDWLGNRPTDDDFDYFQPNAEVLAEDNRLQLLSHSTVAQFHRLLLF